MHRSSMSEMLRFVTKYTFTQTGLRVLDVGSQIANEGMQVSYKDLFKGHLYEGMDMQKGKNVDTVVVNPYYWKEVDNMYYDVVVSGQAFEHMKYPWKVMQQIYRVLKINGLVCVIVPSAGPIHRFPIDCWRIHPDGMKALAEDAGIEVLECYCNEIEPWKDTVLIGRKK